MSLIGNATTPASYVADYMQACVGMLGIPAGGFTADIEAFGASTEYNVEQLYASMLNSSIGRSMYAPGSSDTTFATNLVAKLGGSLLSADLQTWAIDYAKSMLADGASRANVAMTFVEAVSNVESTDADYGALATQFANRIEIANYYTFSSTNPSTTLTALQGVISGVTNTTNVTDPAAYLNTVTTPGATTGQSYTLTTGVDNIIGTTGNDTITASNSDLTTGDNISGGTGTDTLNVTLAAVAGPIVTLSSVEKVNVTAGVVSNTSGPINTINWTGLTDLTLKGLGSALTSANKTNAGWNFTNLQQNTAIGLESVKTADGDNAVYVNFADNKLASTTATLTLNLNNATGTTATTGKTAIVVDTGGTDKFTKLDVNSTGTNVVELTGNNAGEISLTQVTVTGAGATTLSVDATNAVVTSLATVNAGTATGALTANISASTKDVTFTGSAGKNTITFGNGNNNITGGAADDSFTLGTGNNTVTGGAGNDRVIGTVASFTASDTIDLGDGARDAVIYTDVTALNSTGVVAANKTILGGYKNVEVVGSSANSVTAIDAGYFTQTIFELSGTNTAVAVTNVENDTVILRSGIVGATGGAGISFSGALPNQTLNLEIGGSAGLTFSANTGAAGDTAITISSGISTVNLVSTTTASSTTGITNTIAPAGGTATHAIDNASAGSFVLTGNTDLTITKGATAAFTKAVDFNASAFTGKLTIDGSASADVITGGTGNDTITAAGGDDVIKLSAGGNDKVVFGTHAANGKDTITGFSSGDTLNIAALGDGSTPATNTAVISTAAAQQALVDDTYYIINTTGAAANLTTSGTAAVTDWTNLTQVAAYLAERFTLAGGDDEAVIVVNVTNAAAGSANAYVYSLVDANNTLAAADLALVGVITTDTALGVSNIVAA